MPSLYSAGDQLQELTHSKQVLYILSHNPEPSKLGNSNC